MPDEEEGGAEADRAEHEEEAVADAGHVAEEEGRLHEARHVRTGVVVVQAVAVDEQAGRATAEERPAPQTTMPAL